MKQCGFAIAISKKCKMGANNSQKSKAMATEIQDGRQQDNI